MPVRIYDISKKLGLENKDVLAKAKELGIAAARVASSSLDKITAEYLEEQIRKDHPSLSAASARGRCRRPARGGRSAASSLSPSRNRSRRPRIVVTVTGTSPPEPAVVQPEARETSVVAEPPAAEPPPAPPPVPQTPPPPPGPKLGEKVGFIQLPQKPAPKPVEKAPGARLPAAPARRPDTGRTEFAKPRRHPQYSRPVPGPAVPAAPGPGASNGGRPPPKSPKPTAAARAMPAGRCAGHHHQAADHRARTGRAAQAKALQDHRRLDGDGRLRQRQPGNRRGRSPTDLRQVRFPLRG